MSNLENLKKQAKQYLRWHRERYYPVAAEIRAGLPRFRQLSDAQILEASFKLADAQELVARQRGFAGWQALKSGADAMTDEPRQAISRPVLNSIEAQLFVANIQSSCDFYTNKLGFAVEFIYGDPPFYGQVRRDHARLNLRLVCEPVFVEGIREREHLLSASITVASADEVRQLFFELPGRISPLLSDTQEGAMGCEDFRCDGSGREPYPLCRPGGVKCAACHYV